ncbi:cytochrome P450 [Lentithecium fluviatile CBS 122367]|uniref:Cytochrome P450 n=1 Tax=Lentithecium fluviatile CBS 122367 TaxID=1168545 RepID=A0A6G1IIE5_9PLEO|nr:cytochrome P450 [Lentithecium fluviatile CBS 122367]
MDLTLHPEYIPALRSEIESHWTTPSNFDTNALTLVEAFITESARVYSYESSKQTNTTLQLDYFLTTIAANVHRVARRDYTFADGYVVPKGNWAKFNQQAIFNSPMLFPDPDKFNPYRHLESGRKLKDVSMKWPMWGAPGLAWPGRFMVDRFIKVLVAHLLLNYDMKLSQTTGLNISWRESEVPSPRVKLLLRRRERQ